jgi:hypothetical protein
VFDNNAFLDPTAIAVTLRADIDLNFRDEVSAVLNTKDFIEGRKDDGSIRNSINVTIQGSDIASGIVSSRLGEYINLSNIPSGLSVKYDLVDNNNFTITLEGNALSHQTIVDNINNLSLSFDSSLVVDPSFIKPIEDINIKYINQATIKAISRIFKEDKNNDGSINNKIIFEVSQDTFNRANPIDIISFNVPNGLNASYLYLNDSQIEVELLGVANNHTEVNDISNMSFSFDPSMFTTGNDVSNIENISIDFGNEALLISNGVNFEEDVFSDNGSIKTSITLTIQNGELEYTNKTFSFGSVITQDSIYNILDGNKFSINGVDVPVNSVIYNKKNISLVHHIATLINNGWNGFDVTS